MKQVAHVVGVRIEGCCPSMRCQLTLLRKDLCNTIWCGTNMGEVQPLVADESDGNDDEDWIYDMVADIGRGYDVESTDKPPEVLNFYMLLSASKEKVHDDTDVIVL
jgi:hypothetical protein